MLRLTCLSAMLAGQAHAQAEMATSSWARAIDAYLADRHDAVTAALRGLSPAEARAQSRAAIEGWLAHARAAEGGPDAAEQRRLAIRRVQASAVLPLQIVSAVSTRARVSSRMDPYQDLAIEAWERLAAFEEPQMEAAGSARRGSGDAERARLQHFRTWWRIGVLQYLVNVGRRRDFARQARQVELPEGDKTMRAEFHFLQGMVQEHASRSADLEERDRNTDRRLPSSRLRAATLAQDDAAQAYRRALDAVPSHAEARLRLGRVLLERKRPDDAIGTLSPLLARTCETTTCALAALFTGEAHDARREFDKAAVAYTRASTRQDVRQSALVALMQLAVRRGDAVTSADLAKHFAAGAPLAQHDEPDAWSAYLGGRRGNIDAVLGPLREAMLP